MTLEVPVVILAYLNQLIYQYPFSWKLDIIWQYLAVFRFVYPMAIPSNIKKVYCVPQYVYLKLTRH